MLTLKNRDLTVTVSERGAEMQTLVVNGIDYLWCGDPAFWGKHAPVLFPICGALHNGEYRYNSKTYQMEKHGYARFEMFEAETVTDTEAVFLLRDNENSRAMYPFSYEFRIGYRLIDKMVEITYSVYNPSAEPLYMSVGSHEAYACPEGIEAYEIVFPQEETLYTTPDPMISNERSLIVENSTVLPLREADYAVDALIFRDGTRSDSLQLRHKQTGRGVEITYKGFEHLLLWQPYQAPFICVEPWCGYPDTVGHDGDITKKVGICRVESGETFRAVHSIRIL